MNRNKRLSGGILIRLLGCVLLIYNFAFALDSGDIPTVRSRYAADNPGWSNLDPAWKDPNFEDPSWRVMQVHIPEEIANAIIGGHVSKSEWGPVLRRFIDMQKSGVGGGYNSVTLAKPRLAAGLALDDIGYCEDAVKWWSYGMEYCTSDHNPGRPGYVGEGLVEDWSYFTHQDTPQWGGYGADGFAIFVPYLKWTQGTSFSIEGKPLPSEEYPATKVMWSWFHNALQWFVYHGNHDPFVKAKAPIEQRGEVVEGVEHLLELKTNEADYYRQALLDLLNYSPNPIGAASFPMSNYMVVRRPNFYSSIKMVNFTRPEFDNYTPFATVFGAVNILTPATADRIRGGGSDVIENFEDSTNPDHNLVWHPYRILNLCTIPDRYYAMCCHPGSIWVVRDGKDEIQDIIWNRWIYNGQSTLDGYYAIAGENWNASNFGMKRSWFVFDEEIVAIGTDIQASSSLANGEIKTYINSFAVKSASLSSNQGNQTFPTVEGEIKSLGNIQWLYHDNTGYVLPESERLYTQGLVPGGYAQVYMDHKASNDGDFAIVFLPNTSKDRVTSYAKDADVSILHKNSNVHVVKDKSTNVVGAAFFNSANLSEVSCNLAGYIMYQATDSEFKFSVRNPYKEASINYDAADDKSPMSDLAVPVESATHKNYEITVPFKLTKGADPSLNQISLVSSGNSTIIQVRLRVYRKLELAGYGSDGNYVINEARIGWNDAEFDSKIEIDDIPPNRPEKLVSSEITENSITLSWSPPTVASDGDVATSYQVMRDNIVLTTVQGTQYKDFNLTENTSYQYSIYALDDNYNKSTTSLDGNFTTLADKTPPKVTAAVALSINQVEITFSEAVDANSAENVNNFQISGNVEVVSAQLNNNQNTILLNTTIHSAGNVYILTINNITDISSGKNKILANTTVNYSVENSPMSIKISADDEYELYVNGKLIGTGNGWETAESYNVPLIDGKNVVAVKAMDQEDKAGMIANIIVNGKEYNSNEDWRISTTEYNGWQTIAYNDNSWQKATSYGSHGSAEPWANYKNIDGLPIASDILWIWSENNETDDVTYFRCTIDNNTNIAPSPPTGVIVSKP